MFILTADQIDSQRTTDAVPSALAALARLATTRPFERTAGDEIQGAFAQAPDALEALLLLQRLGRWHLGLGIGPVRRPLPASVRAGGGPAFVAARDAVTNAHSTARHVSIRAVGAGAAPAAAAEAVIRLLCRVRESRTPAGWETAELLARGTSQKETARRLDISPSAVSQRVERSGWNEELSVRPVIIDLLTAADRLEETSP